MPENPSPSPYGSRPMEPGDWVMVIFGTSHLGHTGQILDYGEGPGQYVVDGLPFVLHREQLWQFEFDWSGT